MEGAYLATDHVGARGTGCLGAQEVVDLRVLVVSRAYVVIGQLVEFGLVIDEVCA